MDNELFELCKEVYERKSWGIRILPEEVIMGVQCPKMVQPEFLPMYQNGKLTGDEMFDHSEIEGTIPLYTSDYLLNQLPRWKEGYRFTLSPALDDKWRAAYDTDDGQAWDAYYADTPLKALLKLVIALDDKGVSL